MKLKTKIFITILLILLVICTLFLCNLRIEIDIAQIPSEIEYNETVETPKAYLSGKILWGKMFVVDVEDNNLNDFSKIGEYENTYSAHFLFYKSDISKTIRVVDKTPPRISLRKVENYFTAPNAEYIDEGYEAYDEYDGDLTNAVERTVKDGVVYYSVSDKSGNVETAIRNIVYKDLNPPTITLNGNDTIYITQGKAYEEYGAIAIDDCDGDISDKIEIGGKVDTSKHGTHIVTYTVTDAYGNVASIERKIVVTKFEEPTGVGKTIYLTFDDGPSSHTNRLLDILKKYDVKATFFVVGNRVNGDILKRMVDEGHSIGIHSMSHDYSKIYISEEAFIDDMYDTQKKIEECTGVKTNLLRFPGGSSNTVSKRYKIGIMSSLAQLVEDLGFAYFDWNVSSGDAGETTSKKQVFDNVTSGVRKKTNAVVLQHDIKGFSVDAVEDIIIWGLENGYSFKALTIDSPTAHHGINN